MDFKLVQTLLGAAASMGDTLLHTSAENEVAQFLERLKLVTIEGRRVSITEKGRKFWLGQGTQTPPIYDDVYFQGLACLDEAEAPKPEPAADRVEQAEAEVERLRAAIRAHRDQRGHDRCRLDDDDLYAVLPEGRGDADTTLPPQEEFLKGCALYWENRNNGVSHEHCSLVNVIKERDQLKLDLEEQKLNRNRDLHALGSILRERDDLFAFKVAVQGLINYLRTGTSVIENRFADEVEKLLGRDREWFREWLLKSEFATVEVVRPLSRALHEFFQDGGTDVAKLRLAFDTFTKARDAW